ncbi:MAG: LysR substrate-binding domain-containing protein, partial [Litorimonas sp.]
PGIRVQLVDLVPDNYVETLERYEVDLALTPRTTFPNWVDQRPVFNSSFRMIARAGHVRLVRAGLAPGDTVPLDLFCDLDHVLFSPEGNLSAMGDAALAAVGRMRRVVMTMPVFSGVCSCVAGSDRVALVPRQYGEAMRERLGIETYIPPMPVAVPLICMIWHRRATNSPAHLWLRDTIAAILLPFNEGEEPLPAP